MTRSRNGAPVAASLSQTLITGTYRSGTELLSLLLSSHPELSSTMYHVNVLRFCVGRYDPIAQAGRLRCALADLGVRLADRYRIELDTDRAFDASLARAPVTYGVLYDVVMTQLWLAGRRRHWAEKCQLLWREIPAFLSMMPNGRAILVVRDPRSVLASFKRYTSAPGKRYLEAVFNAYDAMKAALDYAGRLAEDRFRMIRYEDLAAAPEAAAAGLLEFLGLDPARADFSRARWRDAYGRSWRANSAFGADGADFDVAASIDRWRGNLTDAEIALCEWVTGEQMAAFGYRRCRPEVEPAEVVRLALQDPAIAEHLRTWALTGRGIEAFPSDPLLPENWERPTAVAARSA